MQHQDRVTLPWQRCLTTASERLAALLHSGLRSDITLHLKDRTLKAHRLILAMNSPVFDYKLYDPEGVQQGVLQSQLSLHEDSPEAFAWVLEYMYEGNSPLPSVPMALEVSVLATKYQMEALKHSCSEYLKHHLNDVNVMRVYDAAVRLENADLVHRCLQVGEAKIIMARNTTEDVFSSQNIRLLSRLALDHLLTHYIAKTSEVHLFRGIVVWGRQQLACRGAGPEELRNEIESFLPHVRFLAMTTQEFVEHVLPTNIFTPSEACNILLNISQSRNGVPLPSICCKIRDRRQ